jgi:hypothetical protein
MGKAAKTLSPSDLLTSAFLERAKVLQASVEPIRVLKSRTFLIGEANVLVRAATSANPNYFFGINYLTIEEMSNLDDPFVAFICGSVENSLIIPAKLLFDNLSHISHDRNGEYKINIDKELNLVLTRGNKRIDCRNYVNNWTALLSPSGLKTEPPTTAEQSLHSVLQGRLIEIGNIRGYKTYCPDKSKIFNARKLEEITTLETCPRLQFSDYDLLRLIDVIWFKTRGSNLIPECAFEVELSTGVWSGVGRMATLLDYQNVNCYVVASDSKKYKQVINSFSEYKKRYSFISQDSVGKLYTAENNLKALIEKIGLPQY